MGSAERTFNIVAEQTVPVAAIPNAIRVGIGADRVEVVPLESAHSGGA